MYLLVGSSGINEVRLFTGATDTVTISDTEISNYIDMAEAEVFVNLGIRYYQNNIIEKYDGTGLNSLYINHFPLINVCYVILDGTTLSSALYMAYSDINIIRLEDNNTFTVDYQNVTVCYDYGITEVSDAYNYRIAKKLALYVASRDVFIALSAKDSNDSSGAIITEKLGDYTLSYDRGGKYTKRITEVDDKIDSMYQMIGINVVGKVF